jgi:2-polyprenyl-3-methyl-5-hydroxy-6-metoxy-1,4-benzoquinol methylase
VSIGCGVGNLERDLIRQGIVSEVTGIDVSETCIQKAVELAGEAGYLSQITYECRDAHEWLRGASDLAAVFFHGSLHHLDHLDELLGLARRSLRPDGFLFLDEYVGRSRDEWRLRDLLLHNILYYLLPKSVRRVGRIRAPINYYDPTEAIRSSQIEGAVEAHFEVLERRDYGGNLLSIIYGNLLRPSQGSDPAEFEESVAFLLDVEDVLLRHPRLTRSQSYCTVILAQPRRQEVSAAPPIAPGG